MDEPVAQTAPAAARNRAPISALLAQWLPTRARVLEVASGTGEHATWFCADLPGLTWQPTEHDPGRLASIAAWRDAAGLPNLLPPLPLNAAVPETWPVTAADAVVAINMVHIAPWQATEGLMHGAARVLPIGGLLYLYGPFRETGVPLVESNAAFDADLQSRDSAWGLRTLGDVQALAALRGLTLANRAAMPANNLSLLFRKGGS